MTATKPRSVREGGHTLLIVVLIVAIMAIGSTVAMKVWSTVLKREKEDELIFRGRQYAMAIYLYRKHRGALPTELKQLSEVTTGMTHILRRPYKDPITGGEFGIIMAGPNNTPIPDEPVDYVGDGTAASSIGLPGIPPPTSFGGAGTGLGSQTGSTGQLGSPGQTGPTGTFGGFGMGPGAGSTTSGGMPIMGVHSRSREVAQAPAKWHDLERYNQWFFLITDITGPAGVPRPGQPGAPGGGLGPQPGRGAIPGGTRNVPKAPGDED